ncbi:DNA methylase [anaerobic digester metagenome]
MKGDELLVAEVKSVYEDELKLKEKEDIETLQRLLRQLFQLQTDDQLNYGIYRIMNEKRAEVEKFITKTLPDQVRDACTDLPSENTSQHRSFIFSHIHSFFSRYYEKGDFMPLRRYSVQQKYAIPYNGEEVLLHWANKDQYYIKTGEFFSNSAFRIGDYTIRFRTVQAETAQDNVKAADRYFLLSDPEAGEEYDAEQKELTIGLVFRALDADEQKRYGTRDVQKKLNEEIVRTVLDSLSDASLKEALSPKKDDKGLLARHLATYTHKSTTDFFIHKDLGGFLTRELDFYIKNEVFHLDDLGSDTEVPIEVYVSRARIIKKIGEEIIAFLAQIEEFQKRLFEKKKFVIECNYCLTLDRVPKEFWPEILQNKDQIAEWEKLYGLGSGEQQSLFSGYDTQFLEAHPFLMIDTKFFDEEFTDRLLGTFEDLDAATGGLMIKSENFQALNLLQDRYRESVKCVYIDPPYNTGNDGFLYKDRYQHSSWLSMMYDRILLTTHFLNEIGVFSVSMDDNENAQYRIMANSIFNTINFVGTIIWKKKTNGNNMGYIPSIHDYIPIYSKNIQENVINDIPLSDEFISARYSNPDNDPRGPWTITDLSANHVGPYFSIKNPLTNEEFFPPSGRYWVFNETEVINRIKDSRIIFGRNGTSRPVQKKFKSEMKLTKREDSIWDKHGLNSEGTTEIGSIISTKAFVNPKPIKLMKCLYNVCSGNNELILDYFAGSGTTAHAVLSLNKEDSGSRKYILVEMADYFDTVMKPRIQKVCYSLNWKDGSPQDTDGQSHIFKYFSLESYEDSLNNITFDSSVQKTLMDLEGYFLNYVLDFETRDSPCRLTVENLKHPFEYQLKVIRDNAEQTVKVDLPETFAYLIGLEVRIRRAFTHPEIGRYLVYHGTTREGTITVIWRNCEQIDLTKDKEFVMKTILTALPKADTLYLNGEFLIPGAHGLDRVFKERMGA